MKRFLGSDDGLEFKVDIINLRKILFNLFDRYSNEVQNQMVVVKFYFVVQPK